MSGTLRALSCRILPVFLALFFLVPAGLSTSGSPTLTRAADESLRSAAASNTMTQTATGTNTATSSPTSTTTTSATTTASATPTVSATNTATVSPTTTAGNVNVTVRPNPVAAGAAVTIAGTGFLPGETIFLSLVTTGANPANFQLDSLHADGTGAFTSSPINIPAGTTAGTYTIVAYGPSSHRIAQTNLQVTAPTATLSVNPTTFDPLSAIQVSGTNFLPDEIVNIALSSGATALLLGHAQADRSGNFGPTALQVPFGVTAGALSIVATGQTSTRQATVAVMVQATAPKLTVNPTSAKPGDVVAVSGSHFQPGETVAIDLVALSSSTRLGVATVDSAGNFTINTLKIPLNTPQGTIAIVAGGQTSHLSATAQLAIGALPATLTLTPSSVMAGSALHLSGTGFIPGETITVQLKGNPVQAFTLATIVAGTDGSFTIAAVAIPSFVPAGAYTVIATGQLSGRTSTANLTVQAPPAATPILSIISSVHTPGAPYHLSPGMLVQIAGSHFPASAAVTLMLVGPSGTTSLGALKANDAGAFGPVAFTVPATTASGAYMLQAQVAGSSRASLSVTVSPLTPHLSVPSDNFTPGTTVTVQGSGFAPGEQVVLALNGVALVTKPTTILANTNGSFAVSFSLPFTAGGGANLLTATGVLSRVAASVSIQTNVPIATRWYFAHGDTTGNQRTVISLVNPSSATANIKMVFLYQFAPERNYSVRVSPHSQLSVDLALAAGTGRNVSTIIESDQRVGAESIIYYSKGDMSSALGAVAPSTRWYLAEGYTGGNFREYVEIMNPDSSFATVDVRFLPFNGRPLKEVRISIRPRSNIRLDAGAYMPGQSISAIVTSDKGVIVERSMRFGLNQRGAHDKIGTTSASTVWLFAQGTTAVDRQSFLTILNPNPASSASVTATLYGNNGVPISTSTLVVNPLRRGNIKINDLLPTGNVALVVTSTVPVVVERPQYIGSANLTLAQAGSDVFGRNGGALTWVFPAGDTASGNQERLFFFNPGVRPVHIVATFYTSTGGTTSQPLTLAPNAPTALDLNTIPGLPSGAFGIVVHSIDGGAFIAEQSTYNPTAQRYSGTQGIAE